MTTPYIQKRIISVLVTDLLAAGYLIDVNDNDADRETHLAQSKDHAAIMAAIFNDEIDSADYVLDCLKADRTDESAGWVRLIDGNGASVISDYTTNLESILTRANALADKIDGNDQEWLNSELAAKDKLFSFARLVAMGNTDIAEVERIALELVAQAEG